MASVETPPAVLDRPAPQPGADTGPAQNDPSARPSSVDRRWAWATFLWLAVPHLALIAAPWTFTWQALLVTVLLNWLTGGLGICLGYHRLLTHRGFVTFQPVRWTLAWLGGLAGQGSAIDWVTDHRVHHALSDQPGDPHSPREGFWWSHVVWTFRVARDQNRSKLALRWAPDLARDAGMRFLHRTFLLWHFLLAAALMAAGYAWTGWPGACSMLVWGMFVRLVFVWHGTWFVNSATHLWGYRNYETKDDSRNLWWVALLSYGEGWHNNHHAKPRLANHGHRWWEIDLTYRTIRAMERLGLVWNVVDSRRQTTKQ